MWGSTLDWVLSGGRIRLGYPHKSFLEADCSRTKAVVRMEVARSPSPLGNGMLGHFCGLYEVRMLPLFRSNSTEVLLVLGCIQASGWPGLMLTLMQLFLFKGRTPSLSWEAPMRSRMAGAGLLSQEEGSRKKVHDSILGPPHPPSPGL